MGWAGGEQGGLRVSGDHLEGDSEQIQGSARIIEYKRDDRDQKMAAWEGERCDQQGRGYPRPWRATCGFAHPILGVDDSSAYRGGGYSHTCRNKGGSGNFISRFGVFDEFINGLIRLDCYDTGVFQLWFCIHFLGSNMFKTLLKSLARPQL